MNGTRPGIPLAREPFDVVGASEGTDLGSINPDSAAYLIRALATHLDHLTALTAANTQKLAEQVEFDLDASLIGAGGFTVKLPTGSPIGGYYIENNSGNTLTVFAGTSPSGRWLNTIAGNYFKSSPIAQQITSIGVVSSGTAVGMVRILISTQNLGPGLGSTIGTAQNPPTTIATPSIVAITTTPSVVLAANPNRVSATFYNNSANQVYIGLGITPGTNVQQVLPAFNVYTVPFNWRGVVNASTNSGTCNLGVTEFT